MMKIHCTFDKTMKVSDLKPFPNNPNRHSKEQVQRLADILKYQGWRRPIRVSKLSGRITAGHGAVEAAKLNGWTEVPVDLQSYENEDQEYADVVADNALNQWSELGIDINAVSEHLLLSDIRIDDSLLGLASMGSPLQEYPPLPDGDKDPFRQVSFMLHDDQAEVVYKAIKQAISSKVLSDKSNNKNSNAITGICETFLKSYG